MKKSFLANLSFLIFVNLLIKPFWILGIDRTVQNTLGPEEYGLYFSLFNFSFLFQVILDFGINNYNNRHIAQDPSRLQQYFSTALIAKLLFGILYTIVVYLFAFGIRFDTHQLQILGLLIINQIFLSFYIFIRSNISALQFFRTDAVLSVLDKLISSLICILILWTTILPFKISIYNFIGAQIIAYIIAGIVGLIALLAHLKHIQFQFRPEILREIIRRSFPFAMLTFLMTVYYRIDGVMIERMLGENGALEAGVYASAFRLLDALSILGLMFATILLPMFSRMIHRQEPTQAFAELNFKLMFFLSVGSGIAFIFYRQQIMSLLYVNATSDYGNIFGLLMLSFINISIVYIFGTLLTANGSLRTLNFIAIGGVIINVVLNLFLIPKYFAAGAAVATVITQLFVTAAHIYLTYYVMQYKMRTALWVRAAFFVVLYIGFCFLIYSLPLSWPYQLFISMAGSLPLAILLRILNPSELIPAFRNIKQ